MLLFIDKQNAQCALAAVRGYHVARDGFVNFVEAEKLLHQTSHLRHGFRPA